MAVQGLDNTGYQSVLDDSSQKAKEAKKGLSTDDFMTLMTTQLKNQDPLSPTDSSQMLSQFASISTVQGINDLNTTVGKATSGLQSSQALQGSSLVGRSVLVSSSVGNLTDKGMSGKIQVGDTPVGDLKVKVYDKSGSLVKTMDIGEASKYADFKWDGTDSNGKKAADGVYSFSATATVNGAQTSLPTAVYANVSSVLTSAKNGLYVNLQGLGSVQLSDVQEVQ